MSLSSAQIQKLADLIKKERGFSNKEVKQTLRINEDLWSRYMMAVKPKIS